MSQLLSRAPSPFGCVTLFKCPDVQCKRTTRLSRHQQKTSKLLMTNCKEEFDRALLKAGTTKRWWLNSPQACEIQRNCNDISLWQCFGRRGSVSAMAVITEQRHQFFLVLSNHISEFCRWFFCTTVKQFVGNGLADYVDSCFATWLSYVLVNSELQKWKWMPRNGRYSKLLKRVQSITQESFQVSHQKDCVF